MPEVLQGSMAGSFYPSDVTELQDLIKNLLSQADSDLPIPKAIISPHAGLVCSGKTAACVYACLQNAQNKIKRVILLGPAHRCPVTGLAITDADSFSTPLGDISIDKKAVEKISSLSYVQVINEAYQGENSLEVQLPFLQTVLPEAQIVPILIGDINADNVVEVLEMLWGDDETLIIVSSDLSHYLDYEAANHIDAATIEAILKLCPEDISHEQACGRMAINALLTIAAQKKLKPQLVDWCNSGDTCGEKDKVVGYAGFHFY